MDLSWLYQNESADLQDCSYFGQLFWIELTYYENDQKITIPEFKLTYIDTTEELDYFNNNFKQHVAKVREWMNWIQNRMKEIVNTDYDGYKEIARDEWENDEDLQDEYPEFDDYFEHYTSDRGFWDMVSEDQRMSLESFEEEHAEAFRIMEKQMRDGFFDNYDNVLTGKMDDYLDDAEEEVIDIVKDLLNSEYDFTEWSEDDLHDYIKQPFE